MVIHQTCTHRMIEVHSFKWLRRPTTVAVTRLLGEDVFGRWLGITQGAPWWAADGSRCGVFEKSFIKVVPSGSFWTACFNSVDPLIDVDIVLPVQWVGDTLEETDLELDILRDTNGNVHVRDQEEFKRIQEVWAMPDDIVAQAEATCEQVCAMVECGVEPFGDVGRAWLSRFLSEAGATYST